MKLKKDNANQETRRLKYFQKSAQRNNMGSYEKGKEVLAYDGVRKLITKIAKRIMIRFNYPLIKFNFWLVHRSFLISNLRLGYYVNRYNSVDTET